MEMVKSYGNNSLDRDCQVLIKASLIQDLLKTISIKVYISANSKCPNGFTSVGLKIYCQLFVAVFVNIFVLSLDPDKNVINMKCIKCYTVTVSFENKYTINKVIASFFCVSLSLPTRFCPNSKRKKSIEKYNTRFCPLFREREKK